MSYGYNVALPLEQIDCPVDCPASVARTAGPPEHLCESELGGSDQIQAVGAIGQTHDLLGEVARIGDLALLRQKLRLNGPNDQLSTQVIACRVRAGNGDPMLGFLEASLPVERLGELGSPDSQVRPIVRALEVFALFA